MAVAPENAIMALYCDFENVALGVRLSLIHICAWAAWKTITAELVKPTSTATKPAITAEVEKSLTMCMVFSVEWGRCV